MHIGEAKALALEAKGFVEGHITDRTVSWLKDRTGLPTSSQSTLWAAYYDLHGVPGHANTDRAWTYLRNKGYTGSISDMSMQWYVAGMPE